MSSDDKPFARLDDIIRRMGETLRRAETALESMKQEIERTEKRPEAGQPARQPPPG